MRGSYMKATNKCSLKNTVMKMFCSEAFVRRRVPLKLKKGNKVNYSIEA